MVFNISTSGTNYQLHKQLKLFLRKMIAANPSFILKPYHGQSDQKTTTKANQIQATLKGMHTYFHRENPRPKGGSLYMSVWFSTNSTQNILM